MDAAIFIGVWLGTFMACCIIPKVLFFSYGAVSRSAKNVRYAMWMNIVIFVLLMPMMGLVCLYLLSLSVSLSSGFLDGFWVLLLPVVTGLIYAIRLKVSNSRANQ